MSSSSRPLCQEVPPPLEPRYLYKSERVRERREGCTRTKAEVFECGYKPAGEGEPRARLSFVAPAVCDAILIAQIQRGTGARIKNAPLWLRLAEMVRSPRPIWMLDEFVKSREDGKTDSYQSDCILFDNVYGFGKIVAWINKCKQR